MCVCVCSQVECFGDTAQGAGAVVVMTHSICVPCVSLIIHTHRTLFVLSVSHTPSLSITHAHDRAGRLIGLAERDSVRVLLAGRSPSVQVVRTQRVHLHASIECYAMHHVRMREVLSTNKRITRWNDDF